MAYLVPPHLDPTDPLRRIHASTVREQAAAIPATTLLPHYPHRFNNREELKLKSNLPPLIEYPLSPDDPWIAGPDAPVGPARIVVNERDRRRPEVMYHDPKAKEVDKRGRHARFVKAEYREREKLERRNREGGGPVHVLVSGEEKREKRRQKKEEEAFGSRSM
ncbi:hypothetical protein N0V88_007000 [Collariella sp. IMI 366227]|nr:hypothetical protein N0V88_007000 [Collariella sp. IMI 366227]